MLNQGQEVELLLQNALALLHQGKFEKADELLAEVNKRQPANVEALNLLGIRSYQKQELKNALEYLLKANSLAPNSAQTLGNIGLINNALGRFSEALHFLDLALAVNGRIPETHNNRGNALKGLLRTSEARIAYENASSLRPNYAEALNNIGVIFLEENKLPEAINFFERAIQASPFFAVAFNNLGNALSQLENYDAAFQCYQKAIESHPDYFDAYLNFGNCLKKCKQYMGAITCYQGALKISPNNPAILSLLGDAYYEFGDSTLSIECHSKSLELDPKNIDIQLALAIAQIPKVYRNSDEALKSRSELIRQLKLIRANDFQDLSDREKALHRHPFYLAYQNVNNEPILSQFGSISYQLAQPIQQHINNLKPPKRTRNKIRVGIVSKFFFSHPVWHAITKGWVKHLNPDLFELYIFNTGGSEDAQTNLAKLGGKYFNCNQTLIKAAELIKEQNLDVVLYPEIGMDTISKTLACLRLAPLQLASWGHPETSGLLTIDYFLSAELFEINTSDHFYSERLIRLPNLGTCVELETSQNANINLLDLGINPSIAILICAGSPSKYIPEHDDVFIEIAKRLGECQFIFFNFEENLTKILKERLWAAFSNADLDLDAGQFIRFIPFLKNEEFHSLMNKADLYLDTIGFSGFNTAMQALLCKLPLVTIEGDFMRGRLASGLLSRMGLSDLICHSNVEYIEKVVELIQNPKLKNVYKTQISQNYSSIFNDLEPIRKLEAVLIELVNIQETDLANKNPI